ncbi:hypothetical protein OGAPHI_000131 [Ogataea philodendri]|uniref:Uncharacterized protein n=1 Tax=Ogataea philodendri TaxID=1378263 RepID=A0A9P8TB28_9ASCO|nr:uncharacterized protein OGAPHI_000131 [Ogataea philodendri]KAH3671945.1 hypothetical protein OGAPHI_000131 [Ogataea philodendri]
MYITSSNTGLRVSLTTGVWAATLPPLRTLTYGSMLPMVSKFLRFSHFLTLSLTIPIGGMKLAPPSTPREPRGFQIALSLKNPDPEVNEIVDFPSRVLKTKSFKEEDAYSPMIGVPICLGLDVRNVWGGSTLIGSKFDIRTDVGVFEILSTSQVDCKNTLGFRQHALEDLLDVNVQRVRSIQHRSKVGVDQTVHKGGKTWNHGHDVNTEGITSNWLQSVIDRRRFQERNRNSFDMRHVVAEFHCDSHFSLERHVLNKNRERGTNKTFTDSDSKSDLWVNLLLQLVLGHVISVVWCESKVPVHLPDISTQFGERFDTFHLWGLGTQSELVQSQLVNWRRRSNIL